MSKKDSKNSKPSSKVYNFSATFGVGLPLTRGTSSKNGFRFLPFSGDSTKVYTYNIYPNVIAKLVYESPTHGAAIDRKAFMIKGEGFDSSSWNRNFKTFMDNVNDLNESANDLLDKISWDYATFSGFALKVTWGTDGYIKMLHHVPFTEVRLGHPDEEGKIKYFVLSNNWDQTLTWKKEKTEMIPIFDPSFFKDGVPKTKKKIEGIDVEVPEPTEDQRNQAEQLIYYWKYKPYANSSNDFYPTPSYSGCLDSILTEIQSIISNRAKMNNGIGGKTLVLLPYSAQSEAAKDEFQEDFESNFTGVQNDGAIIFEYATDPEKVKIEQLEPLDPDTYKSVAESAKQDIITNHLIPSILLEVNAGGGFNNRAEEMASAYNIFQKTAIKRLQNDICSVFKTLAKWIGWPNETISIIPFSLIQETNNVQSKTSLTDV